MLENFVNRNVSEGGWYIGLWRTLKISTRSIHPWYLSLGFSWANSRKSFCIWAWISRWTYRKCFKPIRTHSICTPALSEILLTWFTPFTCATIYRNPSINNHREGIDLVMTPVSYTRWILISQVPVEFPMGLVNTGTSKSNMRLLSVWFGHNLTHSELLESNQARMDIH